MADTANLQAKTIWGLLGGEAPILMTQRWRVELRPAQAVLGGLGRSTLVRALRFGLRLPARPIDGLVSAVRRRALSEITEGVRSEETSPEGFAALSETWSRSQAFTPHYPPPSARWMFEELEERAGEGTVRAVSLTGEDGGMIGHFVTLVRQGGEAQTVHLWSREGREEAVMASLLLDAERMGATSVEGRMNQFAAAGLARVETMIASPPPWLVLHSRHSELLASIHRGEALLGRMEGEWWLNL